MSDKATFIVVAVRDGKLDPSKAQKKVISAFVRRFEGKTVRVALSTPTKTRSTNQNSYYWGVVLTMIASETGHTTEEIHEFMKLKFLPREYVSLGGETIQLTKSTTVLSTFGMEEYLEQVRIFAALHLNILIPLPNEC